jgi:hypothetical protein
VPSTPFNPSSNDQNRCVKKREQINATAPFLLAFADRKDREGWAGLKKNQQKNNKKKAGPGPSGRKK